MAPSTQTGATPAFPPPPPLSSHPPSAPHPPSAVVFTHLNALYTHHSLTHDDTADRFTMYITPCPAISSVDDDFRSLTVNYQSTDATRPQTVIPFTDRARVTEASVCYLRLRAGRPGSLTDAQTGLADTTSRCGSPSSTTSLHSPPPPLPLPPAGSSTPSTT